MEDFVAAIAAGALVLALTLFFQKTAHRARAARRGRRPPGGAVDRHSAQPHLGDRLVDRGHRRARGRRDLGLEARRAVLAALVALKALPVVILGGFTSIAGADHRRPDHRRGREDRGGVPRADHGRRSTCRRRHRELVRLRAGARSSCCSGRKACSARSTSTGLTRLHGTDSPPAPTLPPRKRGRRPLDSLPPNRPSPQAGRRGDRLHLGKCSTAKTASSRRPTRRPAAAADPAGPDLHGRAAGVRVRAGAVPRERVPAPRDPHSRS